MAVAASLPYVWWFHTALTPIEGGETLGFRLMNGTEIYTLFLGPALVLILLLMAVMVSLKSEEVVDHSNHVSTIRLPRFYKYLVLAAVPAGAGLLAIYVINEFSALFTAGPLTGIQLVSALYWVVPTVLATALLTAYPGWKKNK